MTSFKQVEANRLNAGKSTGPRSEEGKQRSRQNALRHGLTAETVITMLEDAADYQKFERSIAADYQPSSAAQCELISRLASVLWRLRRSTSIETGLFQVQAELMRDRKAHSRRRNVPRPEWYDELDVAAASDVPSVGVRAGHKISQAPDESSPGLAYCYLQVSRLQFGALDLLSRYETALWRQAAQILFMLQPARR